MERHADLNDLAILCAVVDHGSFRAAAAFMGTSQPTVSRAIGRLEERLGRALMRRNSRSSAPTDLGTRYAEHARGLLSGLAAAEADLLADEGVSGPVSVSAPPAFGRRVLVPLLASFCTQHPDVRLDLSLETRRVDLVQERVDIAVRFGPLAPSWRRQRLLTRGRYHLWAAPERAAALDELPVAAIVAQSPCLVLHSTHLRDRWPFLGPDGPAWLEVKPAMTTDDVESLIRFTAAGVGVTLMPDFLVRDEVERGELVRLTAPDEGVPAEVFALTGEQARTRRVEALLAHLVGHPESWKNPIAHPAAIPQ